MNNLFKSLNATDTLNNALPTLINIFTMFYGEETRDYITKRFQNAFFIGYQDIDDLKSMIYTAKKEKSDELVKFVFEEHGIEYTKNNVEIYLGYNGSLEYPNNLPINDIAQYITKFKLGKEGRIKKEQKERYEIFKSFIPNLKFQDFCNGILTEEQINILPKDIRLFLNRWLNFDEEETFEYEKNKIIPALQNIYPEITEENLEQYINSNKLDHLVNFGSSIAAKAKEFKEYREENLKIYEKLIDKLSEYRSRIENKYYYNYLREFIGILNDEDKARVEEGLNKGNLNKYDIPGLEIILGTSLNNFRVIDYFDNRNSRDLENSSIPNYRKETIKRNRIDYFKYHGIDLGNDYENYVNSPACQKIWPSQELLKAIQERSNYYMNQANIEYYTGIDNYKKVLEKLERLQLLDKEIPFQPSAYIRKETSVSPNLILKDGNYQLYPLVMIYATGEKEADVRLIHELNHLFELTLLNIKDNNYECICGWDYVAGSINQKNIDYQDTTTKNIQKRNYELFNEIINELLAQKITKMMHENDIYIFNSKGKTKDRGGTTYEHSLFLVSDFFETYLEDIIASRRNNNIEIIWNKVGKENFDSLNQLFHEFYNTFSEFDVYDLYDDLAKNKDTERVQKFQNLKDRRDQILNNMKEYSMIVK